VSDGAYAMVFEVDDGATCEERAKDKRQAVFYTTDRIGDALPIGGSPLLLPGSKHPIS